MGILIALGSLALILACGSFWAIVYYAFNGDPTTAKFAFGALVGFSVLLVVAITQVIDIANDWVAARSANQSMDKSVQSLEQAFKAQAHQGRALNHMMAATNRLVSPENEIEMDESQYDYLWQDEF